MNPPTNSPELPMPRPEVNSGEHGPAQTKPESVNFGRESISQQGPMVAPAMMPSAIPAAAAVTVDDVVAGNATAVSAATSIADDVDVIEKEWVDKAKRIVMETKEDPNLQSKELGKFKAEYVNKRFQKNLKLPEEGK